VNERLDYYLDYKLVHRALERFLTLSDVMSIQNFLSGWFHNVPYELVKRGNVEDFVAYGFYCRTMDQLPLKVCLGLYILR
jgi:hypothetical protein